MLFAALSGSGFATDESPFDPKTGYRISRYRAPVPQTVPGAKPISAADVVPLIAQKRAVLIDVLAAEGAGPDPATGAWRLSKPHSNIPGSVWLPDVGRGDITPALDAYFRGNLQRLSNGDTSCAIIIYCQADCWMSWNAAKRAASYGYTEVYWFSEGTDGWRDWDGAFAPSIPVSMGSAADRP